MARFGKMLKRIFGIFCGFSKIFNVPNKFLLLGNFAVVISSQLLKNIAIWSQCSPVTVLRLLFSEHWLSAQTRPLLDSQHDIGHCWHSQIFFDYFHHFSKRIILTLSLVSCRKILFRLFDRTKNISDTMNGLCSIDATQYT